MFIDEVLQNHLETSSTIKSQALVVTEWNMNFPNNIAQIGNYRYRPSDSSSIYNIAPNTYDQNDVGYFYTNATYADIMIDGGFDNVKNVPMTFISQKTKERLLFSLEDCFGKFRPRSGINKIRFFNHKFINNSNINMMKRPRYYMADKNDKFKYWTSYRTETMYKYQYSSSQNKVGYGSNPTFIDDDILSTIKDGVVNSNIERGIAKLPDSVTGRYYIDDAAPYIVYKESVPTNRIVVKMQTNVGSINLGPFSSKDGDFEDPLYGVENMTTPLKWKIQYLDNGNWIDAISFDENSTRFDGTSIISSDGYIELAYGLIVPEEYTNIFTPIAEFSNNLSLPAIAVNGNAYLVKTSPTDVGTYNIWFNGDWQTFIPQYGWYLAQEGVINKNSFVTELSNPTQYYNSVSGKVEYQQFQNISGLRILVDTMNKFESTFDLIELSPRLVADISDKTVSTSITKVASDIGLTGMPVGQLLASTGSIEIFDYDESFNINNPNSIIGKYLSTNLQMKFYEAIMDVNGYDYFIPIKTLYAEGFPQITNKDRKVSIQLRDMFLYFESSTAPQLLIQNASLSYAIATLLDSIGFSNYLFKRNADENDPVIPYFHIGPDKTVAQVLNDLAISTQTTMFFDEYNNFVMLSKNYVMPTVDERSTDTVLRGSTDFARSGIEKNSSSTTKIANIIDISSQDNHVYNDGKITYSSKYIQKTYGSIKQASMIDQNKTWVYKPVLLWEVTGDESTKSINDEVKNQSSYSLSAIPLNSILSAEIPSVSGNKLINNTMDFGEGIYWISRYNGYFYANGEVIRYDAVQYSVSGIANTGTVWISSTQEYQNYFSKLPFNGKLYPTGLVRIYAEPNYEVINETTYMKDGPVAKHGRGQFGTDIVVHNAGLDSYWSDDSNIRGVTMQTQYLFPNTYPNEVAVVTFYALINGQSITVAGKTFTATGAVTAVQVAASFGNSYVASGVNGSFSGALDGWSVTGFANTSATFVSVATGDVPNISITINSTGNVAKPTLPSVVTKEGGLVATLKTQQGSAGKYTRDDKAIDSNSVAKQTTRNGIIKNFLSNSYTSESTVNRLYSTQAGTIQSSALVMTGPAFANTQSPIELVSYIYKPLTDKFKHFGTRVRLIGKVSDGSSYGQTPVGSTGYYSLTSSLPNQSTIISGSSAGLAAMIDPNTNNGYFFEIVALTENNVEAYSQSEIINNVIFYKVVQEVVNNQATDHAIPVPLWSGFSNIVVDDGLLTGQYRMTGDTNPTVYDLAIEYEDIGTIRRFYLYINNNMIATVDDNTPLTHTNDNNMALFVRGSAKAMFENIYAINNNYESGGAFEIDTPMNSVFGGTEVTINEAFRKYAMSGTVQSTYLTGISASTTPKFKLYFDEFGTIMREAAYFNVRYDKAYPALYAKLSPTFNRIKGYTVSGFTAGSYGAEFLIFNATDTALSLDSSSGNYLRIQGVTFTQQSQHELTVDDYFSKKSDFSNPETTTSGLIESPLKANKDYLDIKASRMTYGRKEFTLDTPYVQSQDDAKDLMSWIISKIMKPRKSVGVQVFGMSTIQLGDIVEIDYKNTDSSEYNEVSLSGSRFVVYNISYQYSNSGPSTTLYLSEVA